MGLNLNRGKPIKYYSSDRIVQLIGNGLLHLLIIRLFLVIFSRKLVFYNDIDDLSEKLSKYKKKKDG